MPAQWKTVRVFISSTFRDMQAERDHLVAVVFPELRERLERLGLEFFDVDLRWGVPEKDLNSETANSWEYCRQWIDRVEPLFVCILGQRYGWIPEAGDFKGEADRARQASTPRSITDLEVRHAVLDERRKRRSYFYLRETPVPTDATREQRQIHDEFVDPQERLEKLDALKTGILQSGRPVRGYACRWTGSGFDSLDAFGRLVLEDLWSGVLRDEHYVEKDAWRRALGADPDLDPRYGDESNPVPGELWEKIVELARPEPVSPLDAEREGMEAFAASRLRWFRGRTNELEELACFVRSTGENAPRLAVVAAGPGQGKSALLARLWWTLAPSGPSGARDAGSPFVIAHFIGATERSAGARDLVGRLLDELDRGGFEWPDEKEGGEPKRDFDSLCERLSKRLGGYSGARRIVLLIDALNQLSDGHDLLWLPQQFGPGVRAVVSCAVDPSAKEGGPEQTVLKAVTDRRAESLRIPLGPLGPEDACAIVVEYLGEYCKELDARHVDALCAVPQARNPLYLLVALNELRTLGGNDMNRKVPEIIASLPQTRPDTVSLFQWVLERLEVFGAGEVRLWCGYLALSRAGMASRELADLLRRKMGEKAEPKAMLIERGLRRYLQRRGGQLDFFHGQLRRAVLERYGTEENTLLHREMAEYFKEGAKGDNPAKPWESGSIRGFSECVYHFIRTGDFDEARNLLEHFPFLLNKIRAGLLEGVFEDYELFRKAALADDVRRLEIHSAFFRGKAHVLRRGNDKWPAHKIFLQLAVEHADDSLLTLGAEKWLAEERCGWTWLRRHRRPSRAQAGPCLAVLEGHSYHVGGASVLPDGRIASWSQMAGPYDKDKQDRAIRIWDSRSGKCLAVLEGHPDHVTGVLGLPDGRILSWSSYDKNPRIWDSRTGKCLAVLEGLSGPAAGVEVLPEERILSWSDDGNHMRIWDGRTGEILAGFEGHSGGVQRVLALQQDRILSWSYDNTMRVWDSRSGTCLAVFREHEKGIGGALVLPDGNILSWSGATPDYLLFHKAGDTTLRKWDSATGKLLAVLDGHSKPAAGAASMPDDRILSWSCDDTLRVWDGLSGKCLVVLEGHSSVIGGAHALPGGRLLSWSSDKTMRIWDSADGKCLAVLEGHAADVDSALVLPDGKILSWSEEEPDHTLRVWDGQSGQCLFVLKGHSGRVNGVRILTRGRILTWAGGFESEDCTLRIWDTATGKSLAVLEGHRTHVEGALVLPDERILSWSRDRTLRLWQSDVHESPAVLEDHPFEAHAAWELPDGGILSWTQTESALRIWDSLYGRCAAALEGHSNMIGGARRLSETAILTWALDHTLRIWDIAARKCVQVIEAGSRLVEGALDLTDGRILAWMSDRTLRIWDRRDGKCLAVLEGHSGPVSGAACLPEGRILTWARDRTLRIWDGRSGKCLAILEGHSAAVKSVLLLPQGRILSRAEDFDSKDSTLRVWRTADGKLLTVFEEHSGQVKGALALPDGRILSWALSEGNGPGDRAPRIWDSATGKILAVLEGHKYPIDGAAVLPDGLILTWKSGDGLRVWDGKGRAVASHSIDDGLRLFPGFGPAYFAWSRDCVKSHSLFWGEAYKGVLRIFGANYDSVFQWHGESLYRNAYLSAAGRAVLTEKKYASCFLQLYHGNRPISIEEFEKMESGGD